MKKIKKIENETIKRVTLLKNRMDQSNVMNIPEIIKKYRKEDFSRKTGEEKERYEFDKEVRFLEITQITLENDIKKIRKKEKENKEDFEIKEQEKNKIIENIKGINNQMI